MRENQQIVIFSRSYIESGMANVNQTLHMAHALGQFIKVKIYMRARHSTAAKNILTKIVGQLPAFEFIGKNVPASIFALGFCLALLSKSRRHTYIYTRSLIVGVVARLLGFPAGVELHQDRLSQSNGFSHALAFLLRRRIVARKLRIIVISEALKSIIRQKYGDIRHILVLHDAAVPPVENLLALPKRVRPLIVYTGKLADERSVDKLVAMAADFPMCDFRLIGGDAQQATKYRNLAQNMRLENVRVYLRQGHRRVRYFQCKADILIAFWSVDVPTMDYCSPLKLFEYMQTGNAILAHDFPVLHEVLPKSPLVALADPKCMDSMHTSLKYLLETKFHSEMHAQLKIHGHRFTYAARAQQLIDGLGMTEKGGTAI